MRLWVVLGALAMAAPAHAASDFLSAFFPVYSQHSVGLYDTARLAPYMAPELQRDIAQAIRHEAVSIRETPLGDKPCLWEGDLFFGNYEAPNTYATSVGRFEGNTLLQPATFTLSDGVEAPYRWPATLVITGGKLEDVVYANGATLRESLRNHCAHYIRFPPKVQTPPEINLDGV